MNLSRKLENLIDAQAASCPNLTQTVSMFWDGDDVYGSVMDEAFAICDFMNFNGMSEDIPDDVDYSPSPCGPDDSSPIYQELLWNSRQRGAIRVAEFVRYLSFFNGIYNTCVEDGLDY